ncbi:glycosyl hydrolase family 95 catalytic domain-containing protein [Paenibacillus glycinis]|uniref:Glycosyl hydrolase family 95 N-terminal domain-containing protein n=1 Tax=Paenibacillus glycinis TaxID=2697035 RepID=A0ABW9XNP4_9BACL|nr:glycoside hydrolase N-terminal domain-containing protein [Paenibacillus glycinis]NBD24259.1 hypothetical protein [Paenibacillus glycinis]
MNAWKQAQAHAIRYDRPAATFFEGALLGNGGLGAVVTTRPDAIVVHFGHNDVWDIRIAENNKERIGDFESLFARLKAIPSHYASLKEDEWYRDYVEMAGENYTFPYPRPMPCGSLLLGFDRREVEVLGHALHVHNGLCEIRLLIGGQPATLRVFVEQGQDVLWAAFDQPAVGDGDARAAWTLTSVFNRIKLIPDPETPGDIPSPQPFLDETSARLSFRQTLPYANGASGGGGDRSRDRAFRLSASVGGANSVRKLGGDWEGAVEAPASGFVVRVQLEQGLDADVPAVAQDAERASRPRMEAAFDQAEASWRDYWDRSGVMLEDAALEQVWYRNLYFYNCSVSASHTCPGLFANWSYGKIGSEWHGDYHMNYNTQQPFWLAFSSNHVEKHLAYVGMVDLILPVSRKWAREYYGLRGAYYPHSAYPVEMTMMPYPVPHWGWEICETPWTVQSLWWHYLYTMDKAFLETRAFVPIRDAVLFMVDYMKRPEASGAAWGDDKYHIFPTVVPELYELTPGFAKNSDCIVDLTLTKFLFRAFKDACAALGRNDAEAGLLTEIEEVLAHFPAYPTAESRRGTVFVSMPGEDPEVVYNVPNGITTIFPGEDHGLHSPGDEYAIAVNSYRNHRNEGGNELVFYAMAGARLGQLDLERFKRQIAYCLLPNGTCTDKLLESGGRYSDTTPFDYMAPMGVWFENFALPAVINECLLQSYNGALRLFPNWPAGKAAAFSTLRAVGGFLVSAETDAEGVRWIEVSSEAGTELRLYNPWGTDVVCFTDAGEQTRGGELIALPTSPGERIRFMKAL